LVVGIANDSFTAVEWGAGFQVPDPGWKARGKGQRIGANGDPLYFKWVYRCYRDALGSGRPDVADIEADITWNNIGRERRFYTRMLLPCLSSDGNRFLFLANTTFANGDSGLRLAG
jgi:hypothetical protein